MISKIRRKAVITMLLSFIVAAFKKRLRESCKKKTEISHIEVKEAFSKPLPEITTFVGSLINE